jgi:hypothetical protein
LVSELLINNVKIEMTMLCNLKYHVYYDMVGILYLQIICYAIYCALRENGFTRF